MALSRKRFNTRPWAFVVTMAIFLAAGVVSASAQEAGVAPESLSEATVVSWDESLQSMANDLTDIEHIEIQLAAKEGLHAEVLTTRLDGVWTQYFNTTLALADEVVEQRQAGKDVARFEELIAKEFARFPDATREVLQRTVDRAKEPDNDLPIVELVAVDQVFFTQISALIDLFEVMIRYADIAPEFGLDGSAEREFVIEKIKNGGAMLSVILDIAIRDVSLLRANVETLPDNTELAGLLGAAETRVQLVSSALQEAVNAMDDLGMDSRRYRQQVLKVTGAITTDVLDVGIIGGLFKSWSQNFVKLVSEKGPHLVFSIFIVALIVFIFIKIGGLVQNLVNKALEASNVNISRLLRRMIVASVKNLIIFVGVLIGLSQLGISLGPLLAGLGIAGFIIGFAMQDSLANFAAGVLILLYKPFDVGDLVDAGGVSGRVHHMSLVNTTFMTLDNQRLVVPNNLIWGSVIKNVTAQRNRRIDITVSVSYDEDIDRATRVLTEILQSNERVLDDPEPNVKLHEFGESSLKLIVRPWVRTSEYWDVYWQVMRAIKMRFDEEGISIPFPQREVRLIGDQQGASRGDA